MLPPVEREEIQGYEWNKIPRAEFLSRSVLKDGILKPLPFGGEGRAVEVLRSMQTWMGNEADGKTECREGSQGNNWSGDPPLPSWEDL